ncbi:MAG: hypothetical protein AB2598_16765 [Candidatus Thiodiazotropha sp.]
MPKLNTSNRLVFLADQQMLIQYFFSALALVREFELDKCIALRKNKKQRGHSNYSQAVLDAFDPDSIEKAKLKTFLHLAYRAVIQERDEKTGKRVYAADADEYLQVVFEQLGSSVQNRSLFSTVARRFLKRIFLELWRDGCVLLTPAFQIGFINISQSVYPRFYGCEVFDWFQEKFSKCKNGTVEKKHYTAVLGILLCTTIKSYGDLDLSFLAEVFLATKATSGKSPFKISGRISYTSLSIEFFELTASSDRPIEKVEVEAFSHWLKAPKWREIYSYPEFVKNHKEIIAEQNRITLQQRTKAAREDRRIKISRSEKNSTTVYWAESTNKITVTPVTPSLAKAVEEGDVDTFFINYRVWQSSSEFLNKSMPMLEHLEVIENSKVWKKLYNDWINWRVNVKGYEDLKSPAKAFRFLGMYIFGYIQLWIEKHPDAAVELPETPAMFDRYTFVSRDGLEEDDDPNMPMTILDLLYAMDIKESTRHSYFISINSFFKFLSIKRLRYKELLGENWVSPIDESDTPGKRRSNKTTRQPFEEEAAPWILRYFYMLDEYGEYLQHLAFKYNYFDDIDKLPKGRRCACRLSVFRFIDSEKEFEGFVPVIKGRDKNGEDVEYKVTQVPNVYSFSRRLVTLPDGKTKEIVIPHMTSLRMNICMYEVGRRFSDIRYVDRRTWDSLNDGCFDNDPIYTLKIETDKTQNPGHIEPAPMLKRLRDLLLKEMRFIDVLTEPFMNDEVNWQRREITRFDPILPLFTGPKSSQVSETRTREVFRFMSYALQEFLNDRNLGELPFKWFEAEINGDVVRVLPNPEMQPHTLRSTFITHRAPFFPNDINILVSHANVVVSGHYNKPHQKDIYKRFLAADKHIHSFEESANAVTESFDGSQHIHADSPESAVRKSFELNREETIQRFGFVTVYCLPKMGNTKKFDSAINLLRVSPMNQIKWLATHVCPVNLRCPQNVIEVTGEVLRCGICPIAAKCVDHIPAIRAERRAIGERINETITLLNTLKKEGSSKSNIRKLQEQKQIDQIEFAGWDASEKYLLRILEEKKIDQAPWYVKQPEMFNLVLNNITSASQQSSYLLERVAAVEAYPYLLNIDKTLESKCKMEAIKAAISNKNMEAAMSLIGDEADAISLLVSELKIKARALQGDQYALHDVLAKAHDLIARDTEDDQRKLANAIQMVIMEK